MGLTTSANTQALQPTVLVIFGVTGNLTQKKLLPALYSLFNTGKLPKVFHIIGFARRPWNDEDFRNQARASLLGENIKFDDTTWQAFAQTLSYIHSDFEDNTGYTTLEQILEQLEKTVGTCVNRIFYFATPPSTYPVLLSMFESTTLPKGCAIHGQNWTRVVVEKPFGRDIKSAQELNKLFLQCFLEEQMYRIDHYLGKETVQNILAFRFANSMFEPLWNNQVIDHIQITAAETVGIENRGSYYEETGALRDMVQNHVLQLLAAVTIEEPKSLDAEDIRKEREEVFASLQSMTTIQEQSVRGQYIGYTQEPKVNPQSTTETFAALKVFLDSHRFKNVPMYLRVGKSLKEKVTDITVQFKADTTKLYSMVKPTVVHNTITMRIQPNEGISVRFFTKQPGHGNMLVPSQMDFCYRDAYGGPGEDAYSRLLIDVMVGDQTLFVSTKEVEEQWQFITPIIEAWQEQKQAVIPYKPGTWGPKEADELIEKDGRKWLAEHLIVCPVHEAHLID